MGYMMAMGPCLACGRLFGFNPERVPSFQGEPICRDCVDRVNVKKAELGLPLIHVLPGAYDETEVE